MPRKSSRVPVLVARVVWFADGEPQLDRIAVGPNRTAAESVVAQMRTKERLKPRDEAIAMSVVMLAEAVDASPADARLWGQYLNAVSILRDLEKEAAPEDDGEQDWTKAVGATEVRDAPKPRPRKPRAPSGGRKPAARAGTDAAPAARVGRSARAR